MIFQQRDFRRGLVVRLPGFLIIGAMKAGTTTLYHDLLTNPQVFFPLDKEPGNLASHDVLGEDGRGRYASIFKTARPDQICGEASTTYTKLPMNIVAQIGIEQHGVRRFELADNRIVEYPVGEARMRLLEDELVVLIVFAPDDTAPLLGATALQLFGLGVDPVNHRLIPVPALMK